VDRPVQTFPRCVPQSGNCPAVSIFRISAACCQVVCRFHSWWVLTQVQTPSLSPTSGLHTTDNQPQHAAATISARRKIASAIHIVMTFNFRFCAQNGLKSDIGPCPFVPTKSEAALIHSITSSAVASSVICRGTLGADANRNRRSSTANLFDLKKLPCTSFQQERPVSKVLNFSYKMPTIVDTVIGCL
jgi:hypothetical protein